MIEVSIILPCRNEEKALDKVIKDIKALKIPNSEIIVSDSSIDNSPKIAKKNKVKLVKHDKVGYGIAYLEGIRVAKGKKLIMLDADGTYNVKDIPRFLRALDKYEFVMGNRFKGGIEKGAMPALHRYGSPVLTGLLKVFFGKGVGDAHCGLRGIRKVSLDKLNLQTTGMEFASEMIAKAMKYKLKTTEIPTKYSKRIGRSKLSTFQDGWRHLRYMLIFSPVYIFFIPGIILVLIGLVGLLLIPFEIIKMGAHTFSENSLFISSILTIVGYQLITFTLFAKSYAFNHLDEQSKFLVKFYEKFNLEKAVLSGIIFFLLGLLYILVRTLSWLKEGLPALNIFNELVIATTLLVIGVQTITSAFMISMLSVKFIHQK